MIGCWEFSRTKWFLVIFFKIMCVFFFMLFQISMFFVHSFSLSFFIYIWRVHARNVPKMPCRWHYKWEANPWVLMAVTTKSHVTVPGRRTMQRSSVSDRLLRMVGSNVMWELRTWFFQQSRMGDHDFFRVGCGNGALLDFCHCYDILIYHVC